MNGNAPSADIIQRAEAEAENGKIDGAVDALIEARAWLRQDYNIESLPDDQEGKAILLRMSISNTIDTLQNRRLEQLVGASKKDIAKIQAATKDIDDSLGDIQQATRFLDAISSILGLVARVVL